MRVSLGTSVCAVLLAILPAACSGDPGELSASRTALLTPSEPLTSTPEKPGPVTSAEFAAGTIGTLGPIGVLWSFVFREELVPPG